MLLQGKPLQMQQPSECEVVWFCGGLWFVVCGLWFVVCDLWFVVCGLWFAVCTFFVFVFDLCFMLCCLCFACDLLLHFTACPITLHLGTSTSSCRQSSLPLAPRVHSSAALVSRVAAAVDNNPHASHPNPKPQTPNPKPEVRVFQSLRLGAW